ncbi:Putative RNA-dependent RNA polymerase, eukaryotic-type [Colletotrichum destructivum]|uniref:RNA-dependent RNA polymerase n=1 Tax=Colletotrichum destructivum TaxID=34406 RepID=A0AAX4IHF1_9PEZI|nr:Putative RNA-dependent RNA polymerase, eukaryotic-type [Colletotrichum destructivum]
MEVFLSNVPPHLTDRTLEKELRPYMNALDITEWSCSSKKDNKLGWVIFLYQEDANKFLRRHGKQSMAGPKATRIFSSRDSTAPDPFALKSLTHRLQDKSNPDDNDSIKFAFTHLACGHNSFGGDQKALVFHQQYRFNQRGLSKFCKRMLVLKFDNGSKVEIPYSSVFEMIHSSQPTTFTLILSEPPRFYSSKIDLQETMTRLSLGPRKPQQKSLVRCLGIPNSREHVKYASACLVYQLAVFDPDFDLKMITLEKKGLLGITHSYVQLNQTPAHGMEDYHSSWARFYDLLVAAGQRNTMPFGILVQLQSLVWNNFLHPRSAHVIAVSLQAMFANAKATNKPEPISEQAFKSLRENTHNGIPFPCHNTDPKLLDPTEILDHLFVIEKRLRSEKDYRSALLEPDMGNHHALVFKAMVTPTRITLHGPEPEPMNRILRRFLNQTNYFMRVTFCDEDGGDLFFNPRVSYDQIFNRYREVLNGGIPIAGRIYQFLGFSHSSLRSHSAWFSAPFVDDDGQLQLYGNIIKALGDFEHIEIPAKCAARIGQAFSETPTFINLTEDHIRHSNIPDVKSQDGDIERVFSDVVGTISQEVLELVWPRLPRGSLIPTCLQIRWGGVKGMLSLDSRLPGQTICVRRESMEKFPSNDVENLEICDAASRPLKLVLNRQMIKIMEDLGVDNNFFLQLQKREVDRLRAVTADAYNTGTFLHLQGVGSTFFLPSSIKSLENYGIDLTSQLYDRTQINFLGRDEGVDDDDEDAVGPNHKYYRSEKILGVLYRNVDEKQIWDEDISRVVSKAGPSVWAQFVGLMQRKIKEYSAGLIRWETRLEEAKSLRNVYEDTVGGFMTQYSDSHMKQLTEVEVFCGSISNKLGSQTRRQKDNSKKLKQEFDRLAEHMTQHMRRKARNTEVQGAEAYNYVQNTFFASQDDYYERLLEPNREALEVSYACLMVGMQTENESEYESWGYLERFKVIAASVVLKELTELVNRITGGRLVDGAEGGGGGFVGVSSGSSFSYAYSGYDVDVGQYPNYGYSQYL